LEIEVIRMLSDYGIGITVAYLLIRYIAMKLDNIERCLRELREDLKGLK
jgi:hypothetical protein